MDSNAVVTTGGGVGLLGGAIVFLFKVLVDTKNGQINDLTDERDYWRSIVLKQGEINGQPLPDYDEWYKDSHPTLRSREQRLK